MKKRQKLWIVIGVSLILIGVGLGWQTFQQVFKVPPVANVQAQSLNQPVSKAPVQGQLIQGRPVRIVIPSLGYDLQVINGYYNPTSKTWTLTKDKAQYAVNTPFANNQEGNTFIYGHYRREVFETLYKIKVGEQAIIYTDNNHKFVYQLVGSIVTSPYDDSLFKYQGPPMLTLQTCSGLWYQNRQLFHFKLVNAT